MIRIILLKIRPLILIYSFIFMGRLNAQIYLQADPFYLIQYERESYNNEKYASSNIRPLLLNNDNKWSLKLRTELFYNSGYPNLENTSNRWVGKGVGYFGSVNIAFANEYFALSAEPYYYINQNDDFLEPNRAVRFSRLNDNRSFNKAPYISYGIREFQAYSTYKGVGIGYSNANMWWGPGLHNSIMMTNNTAGFGHAFLGTIKEKRVKNFGINARYVFSQFGDKSLYKPYFAGILFGFSFYKKNRYSIGITKTAIVGGNHPLADEVKLIDGLLAVLKTGLISKSRTRIERIENWSWDDHQASAFFSTDIVSSKLKLFIEIGRNDSVWGIDGPLLTYPDHAFGINIGMRKFELFNNKNLFFGIEYINVAKPRLFGGDWYERVPYDLNSYDGRRWAAHSGSDSDDLHIFGGYMNDIITILPSINYERHGLSQPTYNKNTNIYIASSNEVWPEAKLEFRLDVRYNYKDYLLNLYLENELLLNIESKDKTKFGTVIWLGIERDISDIFGNS